MYGSKSFFSHIVSENTLTSRKPYFLLKNDEEMDMVYLCVYDMRPTLRSIHLIIY